MHIVVLEMPLLDTRQGRDLTGTLIADIVLVNLLLAFYQTTCYTVVYFYAFCTTIKVACKRNAKCTFITMATPQTDGG